MSVALNLKVNKQMFIKSIYNYEFAKGCLVKCDFCGGK